MAGRDSGFGAAAGSPIPADPSEEHDSTFLPPDEEREAGQDQDPFGDANDAEIPRHTKPFRAWGAAHEEAGPSLWARFTAWLGRLFRRTPKSVEDEADVGGSSVDLESAPLTEEPLDVHGLGERGEIDAEPNPSAVEPPASNDFGDPWPAHRAESIAEETIEPAAPSGEADPLWDAPQVAQASSTPGDVIDHGALDVVWTPPSAESAEEETEDETKRPSFISRLFARRQKRQEVPDEEQLLDASSTAAELEPDLSDFAEAPAHDDFADAPQPPLDEPVIDEPVIDEPAVDEVIAEELIAEEPLETRPSPSLDHSADDAAALASFLAAAPPPSAPVEEPVAEPDPLVFLDTSSVVDEPTVPMEAASEPDVVTSEPDVVASEPDVILSEPDVILSEAKDLGEEEKKKPGFFARLFGRKSKPVEEVEEDVEEEDVEEEIEATVEEQPALEEPQVEAIDLEAEESARREAEEGRWAPPAAVEEPVAIEPEPTPEPVSPYSAWVDARDEVPEAPPVAESRKTEELDQPVIDPFTEGEKTDEFEVVPPPAAIGPDAATSAMPAVHPGFFGRLFGKKEAEELDGETTLETTAPGETIAVPAPTATLAQAPPPPKDDKLPFVLAKFRMFYNEIIRDKHQKSDVISGFATAIVSASEGQTEDPEYAAALLSKRLSEMLELQAAEANWTGGDAVQYYPEAQYAMVCLADETFLTIDWAGHSAWHKHMLEPRMYGTRAADTELFRRIDKLLRTEKPPKGARDLARVYLMVIASGFRGIFREPNLKRPLAEYRRRLYEFSHQADPLELYARERTIFPETEENILAGKAVGRFTPAQKWAAAVVLLLIIYGTVSHLAWQKLSADLRNVMSRVETNAGQGGTR